jgi:putative oxidoreductase
MLLVERGHHSPRLLKEQIFMKIGTVVARILLGLIFFVLGLNGFLHFISAPPPTGLAGTFYGVMLASHYLVLVFGVQVIAGAMLLLDRFVPLALVLLAAVLANILAFHVTMMPSGLPLPLFATLLWLIVALPLRSHFAPLFAQKAQPH